MELISSDKKKCVKCGACIDLCPMRVIEEDPDGFPAPTRDAYKICINCGYCVDACAFDALQHQIRKRTAAATAAALLRLQRQKEIRKNRGEVDK